MEILFTNAYMLERVSGRVNLPDQILLNALRFTNLANIILNIFKRKAGLGVLEELITDKKKQNKRRRDCL